MSVKREMGLILKGVMEGLTSIVIPPKPQRIDYLHLHWCEQCKGYHKAP